MGLKKAKMLGVQNLKIHCDSQLMENQLTGKKNQLTGEYAARNQRMEAYMKLAQGLIKNFDSAYIERFSRSSNSHADALGPLPLQ